MNRPWMPLYVADYLGDTGRLSTTEHGAYLLLIMEYWQSGGLPDDDQQLARVVRLTPAAWKKIRATIEGFFQDGWRHKRIDFELAKAADISSKRRASAQLKHSKSSANAPANAEQLDTHARATSPSQPHKTSLRSVSVKPEGESDWPADYREQFWNAYPKKVGKAGALRKLDQVHRGGAVRFADVLAAVQRYAATKPEPQFLKHPETWLSKGCWDDVLPGIGPPSTAGPGPTFAPPPGQKSLEEIRAQFGGNDGAKANGAGIRSNPGVGKNGDDHAQELPLSGRAPLLRA